MESGSLEQQKSPEVRNTQERAGLSSQSLIKAIKEQEEATRAQLNRLEKTLQTSNDSGAKQEANELKKEFETTMAELEYLELSPDDLEEVLTVEEAQTKALQAFGFPESVTSLEQIVSSLKTDQEAEQKVTEFWKQKIGPKYTERILNDKEFRASLMALHASLEIPIRENGPVPFLSATLEKTIILHETMGKNATEFAKSIDLKRLANELSDEGMEEGEMKEIFSINTKETSFDKKTGELSSIVTARFAYKDPNGQGCQIERDFSRKTDTKGEVKKSVNHKIFELPSSLQEKKIAAKVLLDSLASYDKMDMDEITTHANIQLGCYVWATYGFDWDRDKMNEKAIDEMHQTGVDTYRMVLQTLERWKQDYDQDPPIDEPMDPLEKAALQELSEARTPQEIALSGKKGPFYCQDKDMQWHRFDTLSAAQQKSKELRDNEQESDVMPGVLHPGKLALMGSAWYGKIELKKTGAQQGKSRAYFEDVLKKKL